ncbi:MAG TPA: histidinol dehydrogenase [Halobacteriales archaeon]|nr:histidinol dehydrogenase [Halobacteriales archaeon]
MTDVRRLADLAPDERSALLSREAGIDAVRDDAAAIVDRVRSEGDAALYEFSREFDDVELEGAVGGIDVTDLAATAAERVDDDVLAAIRTAAENVRDFHERQVREDWRVEVDGRELGRRFRPIERVGAYVPGGTAAYPSSALMAVIPAKVAGVEHVAVATPPAEEMNPVTLAAIHEAGADRVYAIGGAQAVAALAYGTETVDPVEKVVGPGNPWVTAAKATVRGDVEIDFLAGPSEVLVIADATADAEFVAADMVAQAEHGPGSPVLAVTDDAAFAEALVEALDRRTTAATRSAMVEEALESDASGVFLVDSMDEAAAFADEYAAEHLSIQAADDEAILERIDSAGSVFLGPYTPVAAGDYASGTNHVLPTGGMARVTGGLSVDAFLRATTVQRLDREGLDSLGETIATLARAEGLEAHADSVEARFEE